MTLQELYDQNDDFRRMMNYWMETKECPISLADVLIENGMESQANAAYWATSARAFPGELKIPVATDHIVTRYRWNGFWTPSYGKEKYPGQHDIESDTLLGALFELLDSCKQKTFDVEHDFRPKVDVIGANYAKQTRDRGRV